MANFPTHIAIGTVVSGAGDGHGGGRHGGTREHRRGDAGRCAGLGAARHRSQGVAPRQGDVPPALRSSSRSRSCSAWSANTPFAEMLVLWLGTLLFVQIRRQGGVLSLQLPPGRVAFGAGAGVLRLHNGLDLQHAAWTRPGRGLARRRLHGAGLPDAPDSRRDLFGRRDGHAPEGVVRHGAQAVRLQAPWPFLRRWRPPPWWCSSSRRRPRSSSRTSPRRRCGPSCTIACCRKRTIGSTAWRGCSSASPVPSLAPNLAPRPARYPPAPARFALPGGVTHNPARAHRRRSHRRAGRKGKCCEEALLVLRCGAAVADAGAGRDRRDQDPARRRRRRLPAAARHGAEGPDRAPGARRRRRQPAGRVDQARGPRPRQRSAAVGLRRHRRRRPASLPHAVGPHAGQRRRQGRGGDDVDPHVPQHARPPPQFHPRSQAHRQDRHHGGEGLDPGDHHADCGDQGFRRGRLRALRQVHRRAHPSRRADRDDVRPRRHQRPLCLPAVPPARAQGRGRAHHHDLQRRDGRPEHLHHALHPGQVPRRQSQGLRRLPEGAAGGAGLHQCRQARRRPDLPRHGRAGTEARRGAGDPQRPGRALHHVARERHEVRRLHGHRRQHQDAPRAVAGDVLPGHPRRAGS